MEIVYVFYIQRITKGFMVTIDLTEEEIKIISTVLKFSITACPTDSISNDIEIDADKLDKLAQKMDKSLE